MNIILRPKFFAAYRAAYGKLRQDQVDGLETLLAAIETDPRITDPRHAAYMLATVKHECADTWRPIVERGGPEYFRKYDAGTPIGIRLGNIQRGDGLRFCGRGYVQITGRDNYARIGRALGLGHALTTGPECALDPGTAYRIMSSGMLEGLFTGRRLAHYINAQGCDYINARRVINSLDRAELIAGYASVFEAILREAIA